MAVKRVAEELEGVSPLAKNLDEASALAENAITDMRRISYNLMPKVLRKDGLSKALDDLCLRLCETGIEAQFTIGGQSKRLDTKTELALYRVVQELVNNTMKHAEATRISMVMNCTPASPPDNEDRCMLMIGDNGKGFDTETKGYKGLGMRNIESRLSMINADYNFESRPGEGTSVTIIIKTNSK